MFFQPNLMYWKLWSRCLVIRFNQKHQALEWCKGFKKVHSGWPSIFPAYKHMWRKWHPTIVTLVEARWQESLVLLESPFFWFWLIFWAEGSLVLIKQFFFQTLHLIKIFFRANPASSFIEPVTTDVWI